MSSVEDTHICAFLGAIVDTVHLCLGLLDIADTNPLIYEKHTGTRYQEQCSYVRRTLSG